MYHTNLCVYVVIAAFADIFVCFTPHPKWLKVHFCNAKKNIGVQMR